MFLWTSKCQEHQVVQNVSICWRVKDPTYFNILHSTEVCTYLRKTQPGLKAVQRSIFMTVYVYYTVNFSVFRMQHWADMVENWWNLVDKMELNFEPHLIKEVTKSRNLCGTFREWKIWTIPQTLGKAETSGSRAKWHFGKLRNLSGEM